VADDTDNPRLSRRSMQTARTLEGYFAASAPPRWMERLTSVDHAIEREELELGAAYAQLRRQFGADAAGFAQAWRDRVAAWAFDPEVNELIGQRNDWYPIERRLPFDLRTRDYVLVNGRSYRRPLLTPEWALERFPAQPAA
jgi:alkylation response protein AidB-like acyl-CoA dehydrogenase